MQMGKRREPVCTQGPEPVAARGPQLVRKPRGLKSPGTGTSFSSSCVSSGRRLCSFPELHPGARVSERMPGTGAGPEASPSLCLRHWLVSSSCLAWSLAFSPILQMEQLRPRSRRGSEGMRLPPS